MKIGVDLSARPASYLQTQKVHHTFLYQMCRQPFFEFVDLPLSQNADRKVHKPRFVFRLGMVM